MLLQLAVWIVLLSLQEGNAQRCAIVAVDRDGLREEFRLQVSTVLEQTATNASRLHQLQCGIEGASLRDDISEQSNTTIGVIEGTAEEMKACIKSLDVGLREFVNETVQTTVTQAVDRAVSTAVETAVQTTVTQAVDRAVSTAVETTVTQAVDRAVSTAVEATVSTAVETRLTTVVETAVENANKQIEQLLQSLLNDVVILKTLQIGRTNSNPASSCAEIQASISSTPSGYYWVRSDSGSITCVYCDMKRTCGGVTGGWMQVANIDMTNSRHTCPQGLRTLTTPKRMCGRTITSQGCSSAIFSMYGIEYSRVCGKVIGYQDKTPEAFHPYHANRGPTIDDTYIDGVSITHGYNPRKHVWSFAAAVDEIPSDRYTHKCPCIHQQSSSIPPWVGNDYFCDTAPEERYQYIFYPDDPLWDGEGCGPTSTCCSFNNPPWFSKQLPSPTTDDIEMRLCVDQSNSNEDITVEKVELYVQ